MATETQDPALEKTKIKKFKCGCGAVGSLEFTGRNKLGGNNYKCSCCGAGFMDLKK